MNIFIPLILFVLALSGCAVKNDSNFDDLDQTKAQLPIETGPSVTASTWAANLTSMLTELYGWGNHASAGYLTSTTAGALYEPIDSTLLRIADIDTQAEFEALLFYLPEGGSIGEVDESAIEAMDLSPTGDWDLSGLSSLTLGPISHVSGVYGATYSVDTLSANRVFHVGNYEMRAPADASIDDDGKIIPSQIPFIPTASSTTRTLTYAECHGGYVEVDTSSNYTLPTLDGMEHGCIQAEPGTTPVIGLIPPSTKQISNNGGTPGTAATRIYSGGDAGDKICYRVLPSGIISADTRGTWAE